MSFFFFFQAEDGIRDYKVTGVQTCALPICAALEGTGGPLGIHAQTRSKRRQAFVDRWCITSSAGICLSLAISSATRLANHGPEGSPSNSPPYFHRPSLSTSSESSRTRATISRSRSREATSGVTETQ